MLKSPSWSSPLAEVIFGAMTELLRQSIAIKVRTARAALNWSQEQLAAKIAKTPESVSNIERAKQLPALDTLLELARVLDLSVLEIIDASQDTRKISRERADNEAKIALSVRALSDNGVAIAAQQIEALAKVK
ncbi:helix-turn-helix transcriptional regulator [Rhizobium sp. Root482]|uniref:helix-turn-helix transcriptional regulator n=1 Tax=Rhizobium sp. Root482 TaxID=1736543 RepID=UPI0006FF3778|nr:helix-turn-helix transcriptional regulator [Rhizobium sp. Root482]KQY11198.1 hypothetical protein ASD31_17535 [Rhizobium sp. Root482]